MSEIDIQRTQPWLLAPLMGLSASPQGQWSEKDLGDILAHQLTAPLVFDLRRSNKAEQAKLEHLTTVGLVADSGQRKNAAAQVPRSRLETFDDLLQHPSPPLDLLKIAKDFAKSADAGGNSTLPRQVAATIYYAAILVARLRHGQKISDLDDAALAKGAKWAIERTWLDERTRQLFRDGLSVVSGS